MELKSYVFFLPYYFYFGSVVEAHHVAAQGLAQGIEGKEIVTEVYGISLILWKWYLVPIGGDFFCIYAVKNTTCPKNVFIFSFGLRKKY